VTSSRALDTQPEPRLLSPLHRSNDNADSTYCSCSYRCYCQSSPPPTTPPPPSHARAPLFCFFLCRRVRLPVLWGPTLGHEDLLDERETLWDIRTMHGRGRRSGRLLPTPDHTLQDDGAESTLLPRRHSTTRRERLVCCHNVQKQGETLSIRFLETVPGKSLAYMNYTMSEARVFPRVECTPNHGYASRSLLLSSLPPSGTATTHKGRHSLHPSTLRYDSQSTVPSGTTLRPLRQVLPHYS
jgi:hypothetical protein